MSNCERKKIILSFKNGTYNELQRRIRFNEIEIKDVAIPFSFYNINSTNNTFIFNDGVNRLITLNVGQYDYSTLISELQNKMNASASLLTFTWTYNIQTRKYTINETSGPTNFILNFTNSMISVVLGFNKIQYTASSSYVSPNVANFRPWNYIGIHIHDFKSIEQDIIFYSVDKVQSIFDIMHIIPLYSAKFGETIYYNRDMKFGIINRSKENFSFERIKIDLYLIYENIEYVEQNGTTNTFFCEIGEN